MIATIAVKKKRGKNYLLKEEEAYIVSKSEIYGAHGLLRYIASFTNDIQQVIHGIGKQSIGNGIKPKSAQRNSHRVIHV